MIRHFPSEPDGAEDLDAALRDRAVGVRRIGLSELAAPAVTIGKDKLQGGRCIVPATMFAEPDRNTAKPLVNRWFGRADGIPFFFAGIWREWRGDVGTIKQPNVGLHRLYSILTTEPNRVVLPIHDKAMPVMLMTAEDVDVWLNGTLEEALKLQK